MLGLAMIKHERGGWHTITTPHLRMTCKASKLASVCNKHLASSC
jgi:hypothetical protein